MLRTWAQSKPIETSKYWPKIVRRGPTHKIETDTINDSINIYEP